MANGASRIFDIMKDTSEKTKEDGLQYVNLYIKTLEPLTFILDDKLTITEDFYKLDRNFKRASLNIGDIVEALVLNKGQLYYILPNINFSTGGGDMLTSVYDINGNGIVDNAEKVNGKTVGVDVPSDAKFTDTTYGNATTTSAGLMSADDKTKLNNIFKLVYPVGAIYISVNSTSPASLFGGSWQQIKDRFLLACGDTYKNGTIGGNATVTLTLDQIPKHTHFLKFNNQGSSGSIAALPFITIGNQYIGSDNRPVQEVGGSKGHNNMPPYIAIYVWKRTA